MSMQKYSAEFKRDAVALVRTSGRPIAQIARELGVHDVTLGGWVNQQRKKKAAEEAGRPPGQEGADMEENRRLRKRIAELEMEREILKRAVVFWVKESNE